MPSSRGAKKAAKTKWKRASLISKRSSSGLPHPRRGGRAVSSPHRSSRQGERRHLEDEDCHLEDEAALT